MESFFLLLLLVSTNLRKILENQSLSPITFRLVRFNLKKRNFLVYFLRFFFFIQNSGVDANETADEKTLIGFAQLSIGTGSNS